MKKKIISFVLAAVMIACMIPFGAITAFAYSVDLGDAYFFPAKGDTTGPKAENLTQNGNYAAYVIEKTGGLDAVIDYIMETGVSTVASDAKIHYDYTEIGEPICDAQYCLPPSAADEGYTDLDIDPANAYLIVYYYSDTTKAPTEVLAMASAEDGYLSFDDCYSENTDWLELADPNSGKTEITAEITVADFGYTMVIPTATALTEANHENVLLGTDGKVSIKDIKHPTDKVNIVYTVDLTNGNLTDGTTTIAATYKYKQGDADFAAIDGTTKVTVYENKTVNDSFVNVTANADQWDAAPAGTYNATVVFNFEKEEAKVFATVGEILATAPADSIASSTTETLWYETEGDAKAILDSNELQIPYCDTSISLDAAVNKQEDGSYQVVAKNSQKKMEYFLFKMDGDALSVIEYCHYDKIEQWLQCSYSLTYHEAPQS